MGVAPYVALNFTIYEKVKSFFYDYKTARMARKALEQSSSKHPAVLLIGSAKKSIEAADSPSSSSIAPSPFSIVPGEDGTKIPPGTLNEPAFQMEQDAKSDSF